MFEKFKNVENQTILVIGDIILDKYIFGQSTRISPEAPVPIVLVDKESNVLGGAANVAANLTSLGAKAILLGFIGDDRNGKLVLDLVDKNLKDNSGILKSSKITTSKTRVVSKGQQMLRIDEEDILEINQTDENLLISNIQKIIKEQNINGVILQDYNKGLFTESLISKIIALFNNYKIPFYVDPKHINFWNFKGATIFKPNLSEIRQANYLCDEKPLETLLLESAKKLECSILMCTLAEEGISYVENNKVERTSTQKIDVVDVSGAGDSALSVIVLTHLLGYDTKSISFFANLCGKVVCMKLGVSTITIQELKAAYHGVFPDNAQ